MKKIDLGQLVSVLANIGVIAGIVFLGFELQQNNELMADEARRARANSIEIAWTILVENREFASVFVKDMDGESINGVDELQLLAFAMRNFTSMQLAFEELPADDLNFVIARGIRNFEVLPTWRRTWESQSHTFNEDFVRWMEQNIVNPQ